MSPVSYLLLNQRYELKFSIIPTERESEEEFIPVLEMLIRYNTDRAEPKIIIQLSCEDWWVYQIK
jgi:hypothetical protein